MKLPSEDMEPRSSASPDAGASPITKARVQFRLSANVFQPMVTRRRLALERAQDKTFDVAVQRFSTKLPPKDWGYAQQTPLLLCDPA